jgi:hypothetical protein
MSENKGFANALLIMLNDESEEVSTGNEDSIRLSIENTPTKVTINDRKRSSISNFISKDLMKTIDEDTTFKDVYANKFNYSFNYSTDPSEDKYQRHIRKGWVCEMCTNFNYESNFLLI